MKKITPKRILSLISEGRPQGQPELARMMRLLGDRYGYGALMSEAAYQWAETAKVRGTPGSEFTIGPCASTVRTAKNSIIIKRAKMMDDSQDRPKPRYKCGCYCNNYLCAGDCGPEDAL